MEGLKVACKPKHAHEQNHENLYELYSCLLTGSHCFVVTLIKIVDIINIREVVILILSLMCIRKFFIFVDVMIMYPR